MARYGTEELHPSQSTVLQPLHAQQEAQYADTTVCTHDKRFPNL